MSATSPAIALPLDAPADPAPRRTDFDALHDLHRLTLAALEGFEKMAETAEPDFRPVVLRFRDLHRRHADEIGGLLADYGGEPATSGGIMGLVNRAVVSARAFFDEVDEDTMDQIRDGEEHVLDAFDEALAAPVAAAYGARVESLRRELSELLTDTALID